MKIQTQFTLLFWCSILVSCNTSRINKTSDKTEDTIISMKYELTNIHSTSKDNFLLGKDVCYFALANDFTLIQPKVISWGEEDTVSQSLVINGLKLKITQPNHYNYKPDSIRRYYYDGRILKVCRLIVDSLNFNFNDVNIDYEVSNDVLKKDNYILLENEPQGWCGLANQYRFIQFFDLKNMICYEFFVNLYACKGAKK